MNKIKLLDEKDKLQFEFWKLKTEAARQYQKYKKEYSAFMSIKQRISTIENRIMEILKEYDGE